MRCWKGLLVAFATLAGAAPAAALEYSTFRADDGRTAMLVSGAFEPWDSPAVFTTRAVRAGVQIVTFDSPGGSIDIALAVGRAIRALGIETMQLRSTDCASACSLAFLGGVVRTAEAGSIGVHRSYLAPESPHQRDEAIDLMQQTTARILRYLGEMGVAPELLQVSLEYGSEDMRYLSAAEMARMRVTTDGREAPQSQPQPQPQVAAPAAASDLVAPAADAAIAGSAVVFEWTPGERVESRTLTVGTAGAGSHDVVRRRIGARATSHRVSNLPPGAKLDVRLSSRVGGQWQHRDYRFVTALPATAELTAPPPGERLSAKAVEFSWSEGAGVERYRLSVGTTGPGSADLYQGPATRTASRTLRGLPPGHRIFVRLESRISGRWHAVDYVYATREPTAVLSRD